RGATVERGGRDPLPPPHAEPRDAPQTEGRTREGAAGGNLGSGGRPGGAQRLTRAQPPPPPPPPPPSPAATRAGSGDRGAAGRPARGDSAADYSSRRDARAAPSCNPSLCGRPTRGRGGRWGRGGARERPRRGRRGRRSPRRCHSASRGASAAAAPRGGADRPGPEPGRGRELRPGPRGLCHAGPRLRARETQPAERPRVDAEPPPPGRPAAGRAKMKEVCRICARELCGNQRRWIFHTASKLNLQVLLSHVLGKDVSRDGKAEFACSKCAFMLDRIYRFDTVIARIEALSIERLQKLLLEKDRLKFCIASMYRKNNDEPAADPRAGGGTVDISGLPDVRYSALLQEDFAYSGFECWVENEDQIQELHSCHASEGPASRPRRCRGCAALRVADSDYEAICKVPRKVAKSISGGPSTRWSTSICTEEPAFSEVGPPDLASTKVAHDGESMEEGTPGSSVESLDASVQTSPLQQKDEEPERGGKELGKCDCWAEEQASAHVCNHKLELALSVIKGLDYKPIQSPRGSRLPIPVKSSPPGARPGLLGTDGGSSGFLHRSLKPLDKTPVSYPLEISDLQELWDDLCEDYLPLRFQPMAEDLLKQQKLNSDNSAAAPQSASDSQLADLQEKIQQTEATNKILQEKLSEMNRELKAAQESSQKQEGTIQSFKETLKSRESETEELYQVIEGQNDTMAKLREMLHQSQLGQLHSSEGASPAQQQVALLDLQSALFCSQLEIQKLQWVIRQKDRQLADAKRCVQFVEATAHEREQQKEASWKHNQELRKALQQLQGDLQNKSQQLHILETEKYSEIRAQEQTIQHLSRSLSHKEQLLQECRELLQYRENSDKTFEANEMLLEKLRQRIQDRDIALERAIDEKFSTLEEKEKELRQLHLAVRERGHDLERLRSILSANEATMQSMESLLRAKGLEVEQLSVTCQNLQWLKEEMETKFSHWQKEQESIIQQLQTCLHDRNKEVEARRVWWACGQGLRSHSIWSSWSRRSGRRATSLCKLSPGQSEVAEELCQRLQRKERMLQELLSDRNRQAVEHELEVQGLLQSMGAREQESQAAAEKMVQALMERNSELQALRQFLGGKDFSSHPPAGLPSVGPLPGQQTEQGSVHAPSREEDISLTARGDTSIPRSSLGDLDTIAGLEKELSNAKEELELMAKKERESRMELSALQSVTAVQEEELQVQAAEMESLTRNIQIKEDLIKDLQMQLVDPEDIPAMERLTQEVLLLREKVASVEPQGQESSGNRRQQLLLMLEGLVDERSRLNEALQAERQLYSSLVKFHAHPESSERDRTLQVELEGAQVLRGRLEEVLGRSLERLRRLETLAASGGAAAGDDTEDASTEFTDSIEEEAVHNSHQQLIKVALGKSLAAVEAQNTALGPPSPGGGHGARGLQDEALHLRAELHQHSEARRRAEGELKELKAQLEEAGFSSVAHIRNAMLSLCLENAELKEQMGEAMSDGWEMEEDKEKAEVLADTVGVRGDPSGGCLQAEFRKLQRKLKSAHSTINLLKEQLALSSGDKRSKLTPELLVPAGLQTDSRSAELAGAPGRQQRQEEAAAAERPCPRPQSLDLGAAPPLDAHQLDNQPQACDPGPRSECGLPGPTKHLRSQLAQCRQRYQDLQEKLLISEATVFAQANQLEKYRVMLSESSVKHVSKQVQVDLQDLGYETCGRSENEAEREETTSPECEEHYSLGDAFLLNGLCSQPGCLDGPLASPPRRTSVEGQPGKQEAFQARGRSDDVSVLREDVRSLKTQLQGAHRLIQSLKSRVRSLSATSDYSSSLERPRKLKAVDPLEGSSPRSVTDEDEGWLSDGTGAFYPPGLQAKKDLDSLIQRVSQLEAQLPRTGLEGKLAEELRSASWPGKYDSLIQDQARELSYLRQKVREGRGICYLLAQHAKDTVKSFEDLLKSNDIDYYLGQSFRELLAQGGQLTERLGCKLSTKDHKSEEEQAGLEPLALRLSRELQEKEKVIEVLQAKLDARSLTPSSSRALSDSPRCPSSSSFLSDELEAGSDMEIASEGTHYEEKKASPGGSDSTHLSSRSDGRSPKPAATSASQGVQAEPRSNPASLPAPQGPPQEAGGAQPGLHLPSTRRLAGPPQAPRASTPPSFLPLSPAGPPLLGCETLVVSLAAAQQELQMLQKQLGESVSSVHPASAAALPGHQGEASSPHYLNAVPAHSPRGATGRGRILEPGYLGSSGQWDLMRPQKGSGSGELSSGSSVYQLHARPTGADLLEEHLGEIRSLRRRLEESICAHERLRRQLEHGLGATARAGGPTVQFCSPGPEAAPQLESENRVLREENRSLQAQLGHTAREHAQEAESLREALLSSRSQLQELQLELKQRQAEQQQLLEDLQGKQREIAQFQEERLALQERDSRLRQKLALVQQQCEEKQQLSQSLQSELQIYEALHGSSKKGMEACAWEACHLSPLSSDLGRLVAEIRALRGQLEQSIRVNNCLRLQLEQQLDGGVGKASLSTASFSENFPAAVGPASTQPSFQDAVASPPVRDIGMSSPALVFPDPPPSPGGCKTVLLSRTDDPEAHADPRTPPALEGEAADGSFASKHGRHVVGHVDDYSALRRQVGESARLATRMASLLRPGAGAPGTEVACPEAPFLPARSGSDVPGSAGVRELRSGTAALQRALEESAALLAMFWRAALPSPHGPAQRGGAVRASPYGMGPKSSASPAPALLRSHSAPPQASDGERSSSQGESARRELLELRSKLAQQERVLQSTAESLETSRQQRESLERFIFRLLRPSVSVARPKDWLCSGLLPQAGSNNWRLRLRLRRLCALSPGEIPPGCAAHSSLLTLDPWEPCKKRSHQRSLKQQEGWACPPRARLPVC
ncbi:Myomegalin, partial [Galemys pyrenaicus]